MTRRPAAGAPRAARGREPRGRAAARRGARCARMLARPATPPACWRRSAFVYGILDVLIVVVAIELVGLGAGGVGVLNSAWGAGGLIGGFAALALLARGRFSTAMDARAALHRRTAGSCSPPPLDPIVAIVALRGPRAGLGDRRDRRPDAPCSASPPTRASPACSASPRPAPSSAVAVGSVAAPLLAPRSCIRGALLANSRSPLPALRHRALAGVHSASTSQAVVPERERKALRAVDLFAPLPLATVETLALHALSAGGPFADEQILRVGDIDTRFYVIADWHVSRCRPARRARASGPGDYFGEIALLRDVRGRRERGGRAPTACSTSSGASRSCSGVTGQGALRRRRRGRRRSTRACARRPHYSAEAPAARASSSSSR